MGRPREGGFEGVKNGADLLGELLVNSFEPSPCGPRLASLSPPVGPQPQAKLLHGESRASPIG